MEKKDFITKIAPEDVGKLYWTSDMHGYHENILKYCNRPFGCVEEMNEALVNNWNSVVGPDDHVYNLGDFCFGSVENWNWFLEPGRLNGHIHLILGNHDPNRIFRDGTMIDRFDEIVFQKILMIEGWTVIMNHFPFASFSNDYDHKTIALCGHIHSGPNGIDDLMMNGNALQWNQYDVGVDNNNYTPISWNELKIKMNLDYYEKLAEEEMAERLKNLEKRK